MRDRVIRNQRLERERRRYLIPCVRHHRPTGSYPHPLHCEWPENLGRGKSCFELTATVVGDRGRINSNRLALARIIDTEDPLCYEFSRPSITNHFSCSTVRSAFASSLKRIAIASRLIDLGKYGVRVSNDGKPARAVAMAQRGWVAMESTVRKLNFGGTERPLRMS